MGQHLLVRAIVLGLAFAPGGGSAVTVESQPLSKDVEPELAGLVAEEFAHIKNSRYRPASGEYDDSIDAVETCGVSGSPCCDPSGGGDPSGCSADVTVSNVHVSNTNLYPGDQFTVSFDLTNQGPDPLYSPIGSISFLNPISVSTFTCSLDGAYAQYVGQVSSCTASLSVGAVAQSASSQIFVFGGTNTDENLTANQYPISVTLNPALPTTDLSVGTAPSVLNFALGQTASFQLIAQNLGTQDAPGASVSVTTPQQIQIVSTDCGFPAGSSVATWNIGTIAAGGRAVCNVQAKGIAVTSSALETLFVTFAGVDTNSSDDIASTPVTVSSGADLAVAIGSSDSFVTGAPASFTLTVSNAAGGGDATGVVVSEYQTSALGVFANNGTNTCGVAPGDSFVWNVGSLAAGQSVSCTLSGTVAVAAAVTLTATVSSTSQDNNIANNTATFAVQASAPPQLESTTISGAPTTGNSTHIVLSASGHALVSAFESTDPNLVTGNANPGGQDVYTRPHGASPVLENMDSSGNQLLGTSALPSLSDDGSVVSFTHTASKAKLPKDVSITGNIFAGASQQAKHQVDVGMGGAAPNGSAVGGPSVSLSGGKSKLAFCSAASNLVPNDTNGANDVFIADPLNSSQPLQLASTDASGKQLPGDSCDPKMSADGNKLTFTVSAPSLYGTSARQVVRKDLVSGALDLISTSTVGDGKGANGDSSEPTISADGSVVAFTSKATDLDGLGQPAGGMETYVSLPPGGAPGATRLVKRLRSGDGTVPNGASQHPQVSHDGTTVVMQTLATNIFGVGKDLSSQACGSIAITLNYFNPSILGAALCGGASQNQNPAISGDGTATGLDSDAPQPGTTSKNSNTYSQSGDNTDPGVVPALGGDLNGQWFDPHQSGQGLVLDLLPPDANNQRRLLMEWFVYVNGHPTWMQGSGVPHAGGADQAGRIVVQMDQVAIFQGKAFPLGEPFASPVLWGSVTLTFTDANTGIMKWTSSYPGFNSGSMAIKHFQPVNLPSADVPGAKIKACYSGNWYEPAHQGHGFEFEVIQSNGAPELYIDWFAYDPSGAPVWLTGGGPINGNVSTMMLAIVDGAGAQFPPKFDTTKITPHLWGSVTFTFSDATHAHAAWNSTITGYGSGEIDIMPLFGLDRRGCQ